ncbi:hypothetical protein D2Q93_00885 [Alicyclobacillaceae bacterium I2511]|nr:hypothetical protein D2Q93_00885 [Alicyclobacillaceae bacterium I2511]
MANRVLRGWQRMRKQVDDVDTLRIHQTGPHSIVSDTSVDWSNPWLALSLNDPLGLNSIEKKLEKKEIGTLNQTPHTPEFGSSPAWLGESLSPYGWTDEDGTLKQVDSPSWRGSFAHRGINKGRSSSHWTSTPKGITTKENESTWTLQLLVAIVLVVGGWYAHLDHTSVAQQMQLVYHSAMSQDLSNRLVPVLRKLTSAHPQLLPLLSSGYKAVP